MWWSCDYWVVIVACICVRVTWMSCDSLSLPLRLVADSESYRTSLRAATTDQCIPRMRHRVLTNLYHRTSLMGVAYNKVHVIMKEKEREKEGGRERKRKGKRERQREGQREKERERERGSHSTYMIASFGHIFPSQSSLWTCGND